jgi:uncharacterized phage protein (TIGR01671 family)
MIPGRLFKFRIWDTINRKMIPGDDTPWVVAKIGDKEIPVLTIAFVDGKRQMIPMQSTGLVDEKGQEIFEGDIMASKGNYITDRMDADGKFPNLYNIVVWNYSLSRLGLIPTKEYQSYMANPQSSNCWVCSINTFKDVIGNVFENPELLALSEEPGFQEAKTDLATCGNCGEKAWDGNLCHNCGAKEI